ncbi:dTDP-4-dehydrorhamnose reductase [Sebaldella termitidis]|jgi:dTDP-4-dehydrorhamnose reductase|uniref:dTDP-4-dehydrorhamnose reductase n=1 Tax=Sebaldella termitidis (strain ATCC 33386 / NCTC 11300) TaxID=526218 RepID=D1ALB2_SEBTE|nr:dTDP-4-dehydrorhamnose reductase [Sebaldella termitidis]ACZ09255.1 dTDP-4-dehydrorhamnose reductase [Sebaldella termitidis ATCC 33386]SUI24576.1 dTDP-4-dehydrorhamnose reductase [Sebaldella termitidis]
MKILLTGSNGQLGYDFQNLFDKLEVEYYATDYNELDITNDNKLEKFFNENKNFDIIINCAAYNDVDKAETDKEKCYLLNSEAPTKLAEICKKTGAVFMTYSTDFVFDGERKSPYTEKDTPNPLSVYGKSKYKGESDVLNAYEKSYVIRTSWVFGIANNNFNKQVINWSKAKNKLNIVDDQVSVPTYSKDLAEFSWELIKTGKFGLYHISNSGECSKFEQAKYVLEKIGWNGKLETAKTKDFKLPAARAEYTKLSSEKTEKLLGKKIPDWKDAIDRFLQEMKEKGEL